MSLGQLRDEWSPLIGMKFNQLSLGRTALRSFQPSQFGSLVGTLLDGLLLDLDFMGLERCALARENYPDYVHRSGVRVELKTVAAGAAPAGERSARLKVGASAVRHRDVLLVLAYGLTPNSKRSLFLSPQIVGFEVFNVGRLVKQRDERLLKSNGYFDGDGKAILVNKEGRSLEDTNFGKLDRIPDTKLQMFLRNMKNA